MPQARQTICIQCGQQAIDPTRINHLPDGRPCPICAERLLMMLPPLLPAFDAGDGPEAGDVQNDFERDYDRPA